MKSTVYLEGGADGPDSKGLQIRCREGFRKLLENSGYKGRMPRLFASGSRHAAFEDFTIAVRAQVAGDYTAMWIDSEDPLGDIEATWHHLDVRDRWMRPAGATDDQVLLMTTCMETLIVADRHNLIAHYGTKLQVNALPPLDRLETRSRNDIQEGLFHATRNCSNCFRKGKRSFEILAKLSPNTLSKYLPSFVRTLRILNEKL